MAGHRRVEPRTGLAGTGMATDVDRLQDLEGEVDRRARAWRDAPAKGFGDVLEEAPPRGELEEEEHADPRRRPKRPAQVPSEVAMATAVANEPPAPADPSAAAKAGSRPPAAKSGPRLPPDPRAAALHRRMQQKVLQEPLQQEALQSPSSASDAPAEPARIGQGPGETPPTGNPGQRNRRP